MLIVLVWTANGGGGALQAGVRDTEAQAAVQVEPADELQRLGSLWSPFLMN